MFIGLYAVIKTVFMTWDNPYKVRLQGVRVTTGMGGINCSVTTHFHVLNIAVYDTS